MRDASIQTRRELLISGKYGIEIVGEKPARVRQSKKVGRVIEFNSAKGGYERKFTGACK